MEQVIVGGYYTLLDTSLTNHFPLSGGYLAGSTDVSSHQLVSTDGVIKNLRVKLSGSPGLGNKYTFTLILNGNPTDLTFDIADSATSGSNMVDEITVTGGNTVSLRYDPDVTPTARYATWSSVFEGDTNNESIIMSRSSNTISNTATEYGPLMCSYNIYSTTEDDFRQVAPTSGTIKNLYIRLSGDPGTAPDAYRFTVRKGPPEGPQSNTALTVTITADATTGNNVVNSFSVVAGDILTLMIEPLNTPSGIPTMSWGMTFVADTDGESIILGGSRSNLSQSATNYQDLVSRAGQTWASESTRWQLGQVCTLKKLYMKLSAAPGAGNKYDFTLRIAQSNSNVIATVSGTDTTGNSAALTDTVGLDEYLSLQVVPDSTPDVADAYWGLVCSIITTPIVQHSFKVTIG